MSMPRSPNTYHNEHGYTVLTIKRRNGDTYRFKIDTADRESVEQRKWRIQHARGVGYACSGNSDDGSYIFLHNHITQAAQGHHVYFANNDQTDCRRANLVMGDKSDVQGNSKRTKQQGGWVWKYYNCWHLVVHRHGRRLYLGHWPTEEEAREAGRIWRQIQQP